MEKKRKKKIITHLKGDIREFKEEIREDSKLIRILKKKKNDRKTRKKFR
jgi:hypothetical protein